MKYLQDFESYNENIFRKVFTGHKDDDSKNKAKDDFYKKLEEIEDSYNKNPSVYYFTKSELEKKAKDNNYLGKLRMQRGGRSNKIYVVYDDGKTFLQNLGSGATVGKK